MNDIKKIVRKSGTSFFWSMRFLPKAKREAMYTLYAFCRHIDDIVDGDSSIAEKQELLQAWREELDNIYDKKVPATEIGRRIYKNCMRFKLPKSEFLRLIDSISMDVPNPVQAPRLSDFYRYCRGVAGVPGSLSLRIFGCNDEKMIEEDALSNRLYIPREFLQKAEITATDPRTVVTDKNLAIAREELAKIANEDFKKSYELIKYLDKRTARPVKIIAGIYKKYFDIMQERGWEVISPKPTIGRFGKLALAVKALLAS